MTGLPPEQLAEALAASPAIRHLGLSVLSCDPAIPTLALEMPLLPAHERLSGSNQFHGGPIASLIDTAGDFAVALALGNGVPTINLRIDYLRPASGPGLIATATARRIGRTIAVCDVDVTDSLGRLVAIGRGTYGAPTS
jgi:uncharacterized protein (TIGR00369 family)